MSQTPDERKLLAATLTYEMKQHALKGWKQSAKRIVMKRSYVVFCCVVWKILKVSFFPFPECRSEIRELEQSR